MGEAAEMMLDGYLDWKGEYNGDDNYAYGLKYNTTVNKVSQLMKNYGKWKWQYKYELILAYREQHLLDKGVANTCSQICKYICGGGNKANWNQFKKYLRKIKEDNDAKRVID